MGTKKFGGNKRDNPLSVYFSREVRERLEEIVKKKEYGSRSELVEKFVKKCLDSIDKDQEALKYFKRPDPFEA